MDSGPPLADLLRGARGGLVEEIRDDIPRVVRFYATLSIEVRQTIASRVVDLVLDQLASPRPELVAAFGLETFSNRPNQGARLGEIVAALQRARRMFVRRLWESGAEMHVLRAAIERIDDVFDALIASASPAFEANLQEARAAIDRIESRYRHLYQKTPAMMHSIHADGRLEAVSDRWLATLGYTAAEVIGKRSTDFLAEESRRLAIETNIPRLRQEGHLFDLPYQFVKKNGEVIDVRFSSIAVRDEQGEVVKFLAVFEDVTAELAATRALRESEERWRAVLELSPLPLSIHRDGVLVWVNDACVKILGGKDASDIVGRRVLDLVHPDDHELVIARMKAGQSQAMHESLPPIEERIVRLDGKIIYAELAARPIVYEGKRATQMATIDVTARKLAEEARRTSEAQARVIEAQEEALRALSTPLIPLGDGILVLPLVGRVNAERAERILATLAEGVVAQQASFAIVDVTGMPEADASAIEALVRVTHVIRLLGAEVMVTGVRPAIASALVTLGAELGRVTTRATLRDGIAYATNKRRSTIARRPP